jgi:two-component system, chemotaxis family, CheB/CheR fusion protein
MPQPPTDRRNTEPAAPQAPNPDTTQADAGILPPTAATTDAALPSAHPPDALALGADTGNDTQVPPSLIGDAAYTAPTEPAPPRPDVPPVVGIVCSAGGLKALEEFFAAVPPDSGLAWLVMPHLAPDQPSLLAGLLGKHSTIPVGAAVDGVVPAKNRAYIAQPGAGVTLRGGRIRIEQLQGTAGRRAALDAVLVSLAEDLGAAALGVVLSGSGDAGVKGLRAIVNAGGLGVVQQPATADYPDMPQAAIDAGLADLALPPAQIPIALVEHTRPGGEAVLKDFSPEPSEQNALRRLLALLRVRTRYDFRDYRPSMVSRRIRRRMDQLGIGRTEDYLARLRGETDELKHLNQDLMIGVTGFFRDEEAFAELRDHVIEPLVHRHRGEAPLRIWVPGCATGEEAYSIAMLAIETFSAGGRAANVQVFATDIDETALERARHGVYTEAAMQGLSRERRARFFTNLGGGRQQVSKALRECVVFAVQNLLRDPPFSRIDLVSCRNVLIYLKPEAQEQVIARFHFALSPGGFLFLGNAEAVGRHTDLFETVSKRWRIFVRIGSSRSDVFGAATAGVQPPTLPPEPQSGTNHALGRFKDTARRALCELYAPAAVLINAGYEILYYQGPTTDYLELPTGEPTRSLVEMLRKGLVTPVRGACQAALTHGKASRVRDAKVLRGTTRVPVEVLVHPVRESRLAERLLLVTFRDRDPAPAASSEAAEDADGAELTAIEQLEFELRATRDDLHSTIEELQTANEQLKAANEEMASTNEEMQSTNEELQTAKEELQSVNEELATVNSQMQEKVAEVEQRNDDITNLLASSNTITVFLDRELRVKLFTPACKDLLNLRPGDIGRPFTEIKFRINDADLLTDCAAVLETLTPIERQLDDGSGRRWLRRVLPYRSQENRIDGVVLTLVDITVQTAAELAVRASERHYRRLFEDAPLTMLEQDWSAVAKLLRGAGPGAADPRFFAAQPDLLAACRDGIRITAVNGAARALLGIADDADAGQLRPHLCCTDKLAELLAAFASGRRVALCEDLVSTANGRRLPMLCQFALMPGNEAAMDRVLVMLLDLTAQKALEQQLADSELRLRRALRVVHEAVWEYDFTHRELWWSDEYERQFGKPAPMGESLPDWWAAGIHPDDRAGALARLQGAIDGDADAWQAEYRRQDVDRRWVPVLARGAIDRDSNGQVVRMLGCMLDVGDLKDAQRALAERELRLRSILEAAAEAIITTDADGRIESFNRAAEAMFRCTVADVAGQPIDALLARIDGRPADVLTDSRDGAPRLLHGRRGQGEWFPLELSARFVAEQNLWVLVGRDVSEQRRLERDVIELSTRQQEEVGREIHDGLGQELTALVMLAHSMRQQLKRSGADAAGDAFTQMEDYLRHALDTCRTIARGLSAEVSAPGLENALAELAAGMERAAGIDCRFSHTGHIGALGEQQAAHLYRIAQEALSNAVRHAQPTRVDISLEAGDDELILRIRDDGHGIPPGAKRGLGLRLMVYRAGMLGGTCTVTQPDGGGTLVECRVPNPR